MPLSWNEIGHRAIIFSKEWAMEKREIAESQSFWNNFFDVFGVKRRAVASFEEPVKSISGDWEYIDIFWPGTMLAEHKSSGKDLDKAKSQGMKYIRALKDSGRESEIPRYLVISDFAHIALYDLEAENEKDSACKFPINDFHKHVRRFGFVAGYKQHKIEAEDPVNLEAVKLMCQLHDTLESGGYSGHDLKRFLVRILFCLFAEDTNIFPPQAFQIYIKDRTSEDGSDLGLRLARLFEVLNTPENNRQKNLDEYLREFPYVNGDLFSETLHFADFTQEMRDALVGCTRFDWSRISPAVFGSLFQSVMEPKERRQLGAHYTAEKNILKLVRSLFLNDLIEEFETIAALKVTKHRENQLDRFHNKLSQLRFLDPACGCGNFLVITYRELRILELEVLKLLYGTQREFSLEDVNKLSKIDVDQMYGIELEEFPARIAEVALWLMDHQMNLMLSTTFSQFYLRIPLRKSPHIHVRNALQLDWKEVISPEKCSYILGNPPFVGAMFMTPEQREEMVAASHDLKGVGVLDYVCAWYFIASEFIRGTQIRVGFVSTNSISQGEQAGLLWTELFTRKIKIHFAYRTFPWESEARGKAHVHVVIIGFGGFDVNRKFIYDFDPNSQNITTTPAKNISPYLVEGNDFCLTNRKHPLSQIPEMHFGSMPRDGGHLIFTDSEKEEFLKKEPQAKKLLRPYTGAQEFINGGYRWCLWLLDVNPADLKKLPYVLERIEKVRKFRLGSKAAATRKFAATPGLFCQIAQPETNYLLIPRVSSERRKYIPIGFAAPELIANDQTLIIPDALLYHLGVLSSEMHMAWVRQLCGRLKSDFRYSKDIIYNNFPWPKNSPDNRKIIEKYAQVVLDTRKKFPNSELADLYDPLTMPPQLLKAHQELDNAVDSCYRNEPFTTERQRIEFLFNLFEKTTVPLVAAYKKSKRSVKNKTTIYLQDDLLGFKDKAADNDE